MRKITLMTILFLTILSCEDDSVKCDGKLEIETVKEIYKDELMKMNFAFKMNGIDDLEGFLYGFFENNVKFDLIRTKAIDKELKSCECAAKLTFELDPEIKKDLENRTSNNNPFQQEILSKFLANDGIDIEYSLQETNDGNFVAETYLINEELSQVAMTYYMLEKSYKETDLVLEKDKIYKFGTGTEDCSYEIWFILSPRNNEVKGAHTQDCIGDNGAGERKFNGIFENGKIIANIDNKEYFELEFKGKELEYILTKTILENGEEMTFSENNTMTYELIK
jgi:hypothetical protein